MEVHIPLEELEFGEVTNTTAFSPHSSKKKKKKN